MAEPKTRGEAVARALGLWASGQGLTVDQQTETVNQLLSSSESTLIGLRMAVSYLEAKVRTWADRITEVAGFIHFSRADYALDLVEGPSFRGLYLISRVTQRAQLKSAALSRGIQWPESLNNVAEPPPYVDLYDDLLPHARAALAIYELAAEPPPQPPKQ